MYYHLSDNIYLAQFREEFILLDTKQDKYTICFKPVSDLIMSLLKIGSKNTDVQTLSSHSNPLSSQDLIYLEQLLKGKILEEKNVPFPYLIDQKVTTQGVTNVDWRLPLDSKKINLNLSVLKAFWVLMKVNFYMKHKGFYDVIRWVKNLRKFPQVYNIPQEQELNDLAHIVNKACILYPTRIKCLEWAITYVVLAVKRGWKCNLEIGVQNYPFFAHAWVECEGKVIMDSQELREGLAIILNEPFRKLRA